MGLQPNTIDALLHDLHSYTMLNSSSRWRYLQITSDENRGALLCHMVGYCHRCEGTDEEKKGEREGEGERGERERDREANLTV